MTSAITVLWGSSPVYRGRAHLIMAGAHVSFCRLPIDCAGQQRADFGRTCPECALEYVESTLGDTQWAATW